jgi:hypothetical protein
LWKVTLRAVRGPTHSRVVQAQGELSVSDSDKTGALAGSREARLQSLNDPSEPAGIEMRTAECASAGQPQLTRPSDVLQAVKGL